MFYFNDISIKSISIKINRKSQFSDNNKIALQRSFKLFKLFQLFIRYDFYANFFQTIFFHSTKTHFEYQNIKQEKNIHILPQYHSPVSG